MNRETIWPVHFETTHPETDLTFPDEETLEKFIRQLEAIRQIKAVKNAIARTAGMVIDHLRPSRLSILPTHLANHPAITIPGRFDSTLSAAALETRIYGNTRTIMLRYVYEKDVLTARFNHAAGNVGIMNFFSTRDDEPRGLKTLLLPGAPSEMDMHRLGELTGGKWVYVWEEGRLTARTGETNPSINVFTHVGSLEIPHIGAGLGGMETTIERDLWISPWGVGAEK